MRAIHRGVPAVACVVVAAAALPLLGSRTALAADWYVDAAATAGGDGSKTKPFPTVNAALARLQRGDTVWLATGTYDEVVDIATLPGTGTTTFRAQDGANAVISGASGSASAGYVIQTAVPNVTFEDLTIEDAMSGALGVQFYYADGGQVVDCTTRNMSANAVTFYSSNQGTVTGSTCQGNIAGRKTTGTVVENNEVYGASAEGIGLYDGSTECTVAHNIIHDNTSVNLYLDSISHSTFDGNLIYETDPDNDLEGIEISDEGHYDDLPAPANSYNTVINNVVVGHNLGIVFWYSGEWPTQALNDESGLRYDVISNNTLIDNKGSLKWDASPAHVGTTIQNNVFATAAGTSPVYLLQAKSAGGITLDHDLWFAPDLAQPFLWLAEQADHAGFVTDSGQGGGDVLGDPLLAGPWTAPPATNLALTSASPAVGAGISLAAVIHDFLGAPRPVTGTDLGAFQYGAAAPEDAGFMTAGEGSATGDGGPGSPDLDDGGGGATSPSESDGATREGGDLGSSSGSSGAAPSGSTSSGCSCSEAAGHPGSRGPTVVVLLAAACLARGRAPRRAATRADRSETRSRAGTGRESGRGDRSPPRRRRRADPAAGRARIE
jgi:parallel beta-helix repeat protein